MERKLYIIENSQGYHKIGYSKDPEKRLKQLVTGTSDTLSLKRVFRTKHASHMEAFLKNYFKHKLIQGEWFQLDKEDIDKVDEIVRVKEIALDTVSM